MIREPGLNASALVSTTQSQIRKSRVHFRCHPPNFAGLPPEGQYQTLVADVELVSDAKAGELAPFRNLTIWTGWQIYSLAAEPLVVRPEIRDGQEEPAHSPGRS